MASLDDLALFVGIVDAGSLAAAARSLELPKSTVSRRLMAIEGLLSGIQDDKRSAVLEEIFSRVQEAKRVADLELLVGKLARKRA